MEPDIDRSFDVREYSQRFPTCINICHVTMTIFTFWIGMYLLRQWTTPVPARPISSTDVRYDTNAAATKRVATTAMVTTTMPPAASGHLLQVEPMRSVNPSSQVAQSVQQTKVPGGKEQTPLRYIKVRIILKGEIGSRKDSFNHFLPVDISASTDLTVETRQQGANLWRNSR